MIRPAVLGACHVRRGNDAAEARPNPDAELIASPDEDRSASIAAVLLVER